MSGQRSGALDEDDNDEDDDYDGGNNIGNNMDDGNDTLMAGGCSMRESEPVRPPPQPAAIPRYDGGRFNSSSRQHGSENSSRSQSLMNVPHHQRHRCGSFEDNSGLAVFCWGRGEDGQLGLGDTADQDEPVYVSTVLLT
jgi:Regulator of chromosome condensation (RCC1) repeat